VAAALVVEAVVWRETVEVRLPAVVEVVAVEVEVEVEAVVVVVTVVELAGVRDAVAEPVAKVVAVPEPPEIANWGEKLMLLPCWISMA
jgi:hypothetical protein